jgi:hypothetical protein
MTSNTLKLWSLKNCFKLEDRLVKSLNLKKLVPSKINDKSETIKYAVVLFYFLMNYLLN